MSIDESRGPWLPLGADPLGRDVCRGCSSAPGCHWRWRSSRRSARCLAAGDRGLAGFAGGRLEPPADGGRGLRPGPARHLRGAGAAGGDAPGAVRPAGLLDPRRLVLAAAGWPLVARGVRGIIAAERQKEYAEAAYPWGQCPLRILLRHLLPATTGFLSRIETMMVPAFVVSEGTLTLVGLGFPVPAASWGAMLRDAWQGAAFTDAPWLMSPAFALALTVLLMHMLGSGCRRGPFCPPRPVSHS